MGSRLESVNRFYQILDVCTFQVVKFILSFTSNSREPTPCKVDMMALFIITSGTLPRK